jgi:hypothetical protein
MLARLVSKLLSELRGIIHARTFHLLGKAVVEKANWTDAGTVRSVLTLMREIDDNAARQPAVGRAPAVASHPDDELPDTE